MKHVCLAAANAGVSRRMANGETMCNNAGGVKSNIIEIESARITSVFIMRRSIAVWRAANRFLLRRVNQ